MDANATDWFDKPKTCNGRLVVMRVGMRANRRRRYRENIRGKALCDGFVRF
jgi:hypothetical protein